MSKHMGLLAVMFMVVTAIGCQSNQGTTLARVPELEIAGYALGGDAVVVVSTSARKNPAKSGLAAYETTTHVKVIDRAGKERKYQLLGKADCSWLGSPDLLVTSSERTNLLYRRIDTGSNSACSIDLATGKVSEILSSTDKFKNALYSPDGKSLALLSGVEEYRVAIVNSEHPEKRFVWQNDGSIPGLLQLIGWSESGRGVILSSEYTPSGGNKNYRIFVLCDNAEEPKELYRFADGSDIYGMPIVNKDKIIYCSQSGSLISVSYKQGRKQTIFTAPDGYKLYNLALSPSGHYLSTSISSNPDTNETGFYVIDKASGKSACVKAKASDGKGPAIELLEWHPKKDLLLAVYSDADGIELREYDVRELLDVK